MTPRSTSINPFGAASITQTSAITYSSMNQPLTKISKHPRAITTRVIMMALPYGPKQICDKENTTSLQKQSTVGLGGCTNNKSIYFAKLRATCWLHTSQTKGGHLATPKKKVLFQSNLPVQTVLSRSLFA